MQHISNSHSVYRNRHLFPYNALIKVNLTHGVPAERSVYWIYYPKSDSAPEHLRKIADVFVYCGRAIDSSNQKFNSNQVLHIAKDSLEQLGFVVEAGSSKVLVPVLFGKNGQVEKSFHADGFNRETKTVLEVEAGRAVDNNQFLKDLFEACMMHDVEYLVIVVRRIYRKRGDFETVIKYFDTLYASRRLNLPLKGIMIIGY